MVDYVSRKLAVAAMAALAGLASTSLANAQTMNANSASYNAGYGRAIDQENQPVDVSVRDANGNLTVVDGVIQAGADGSVFASASGVLDTVSGVSTQSGASAIGNNLTVVTTGSNNTVIVNSTQNNSGNVSATSTLNGGVSNGH
ncbi:MAG TPA: holdfast anchoring protein HfaA [Caulobacteraceae bacterium]|jgi:holdfast attachment protein HfaA